jgi:hypothetical protein
MISLKVPISCLCRDSSKRANISLYNAQSEKAIIENASRIISLHLWASSITIVPIFWGSRDKPLIPNTVFPLKTFLLQDMMSLRKE